MMACCFAAGREKNLSFILSPPLDDSVKYIINPLTDFEKPLYKLFVVEKTAKKLYDLSRRIAER